MRYKKKPDRCDYNVQFRWNQNIGEYVVDKIFWQVLENGRKGKRHYLTSMPLDKERGTVLRLGDVMPNEFAHADTP